jgi:MFS family permease
VISVSLLPALGTLPLLFMAMALYGAAFAMLFPSMSALVVDYTSPEERGVATGIFHSLLTAGVAVGAPAMGWVAHLAGIRLGLALSSGAAAVALIIVLVTLRRDQGQDKGVASAGSQGYNSG